MTPAQRRFTAERFLAMLESGEEPTCSCPLFELGVTLSLAAVKKCQLCQEAVHMKFDIESCPCWRLGPAEAVKCAWLFIEESGILEAPHAPK